MKYITSSQLKKQLTTKELKKIYNCDTTIEDLVEQIETYKYNPDRKEEYVREYYSAVYWFIHHCSYGALVRWFSFLEDDYEKEYPDYYKQEVHRKFFSNTVELGKR